MKKLPLILSIISTLGVIALAIVMLTKDNGNKTETPAA